MKESYGHLDKRRTKKIPGMADLYRDIRADLLEVEEELKSFTRSPNKLIAEITDYLFRNTGKRIRPALLILCAKLFGYKGKEHIRMSGLVETIHTASLLHDDIIDNADLRRGRKTVHARWGPNITVLLGDYLYIETIDRALQSKFRQVVHILAQISTQMIDGELTEYYVSWNSEIQEKDYLEIINKKTASLFSASCRIGGLLAGVSGEDGDLLARLGTNLGMIFQIVDDLLDYTGEERKLGKPVLSDLREGRITLPLIYTLNNDGRKNREWIVKVLEKKSLEKGAAARILDIVKSNGALEYARSRAAEYSLLSKELILRLPPSTYRNALSFFPDYILHRNR